MKEQLWCYGVYVTFFSDQIQPLFCYLSAVFRIYCGHKSKLYAGLSSVAFPYTGCQSPSQSSYRHSLLRSAQQTRVTLNPGLPDVISARITDDPTSSANHDVFSHLYMDLGDCTSICEFCGALFWFPERLLSYSVNRRPSCLAEVNGYVALFKSAKDLCARATVPDFGKTYLWKTIISAIRSKGKVVLAVAASGIASLLLPAGRTAHSRFKIPFDLTDTSVCNVKKNTQLSELLMETSLIIWDEAPMSDRRCFESLDKSLRDIVGDASTPFGGKSVLLGGDFRQTLPVKPKSPKSEIVALSLPRSYLWNHFKIYRLKDNMRVMQPTICSQDKEDVDRFSKWLLDVGDGKIGVTEIQSQPDMKTIEIPDRFLIPDTDSGILDLIHFIYDDTTMENETLGSIRLGGSGLPIEVRILRKGIPHLREDDTCYLLVDQSGEAIVAIAHKDERKYVEPKLQTMSCYRIENYVCVSAIPYVNIINHPVSIRIGAAASIDPLPNNEDLPRVYFEFSPYEDVSKLAGNKQRVIDYIGLLQKKEYKKKEKCGRSIEAALWKEIITKADRFDKHAIDTADTPTVIALTSMRIQQFNDQTQLSSTTATYMYLNPTISETQSLINWFNTTHGNNDQPWILTRGDNPTTIQDILHKTDQELNGKTFPCNASVTQIITQKDWYRLTAKVADETGSITATIFDDAVATLVGITCSDLLNKEGYSDMTTIPAPLHAIKGKTKKFFLHTQKDARTSNIKYTVNKTSDLDFNTMTSNTTVAPSVSPATPLQLTPTPSTKSAPKTATTATKRIVFASSDNPIRESKLRRYPDE
ncbi:hypothetical protein E3N88_34398 [Mikania micrantha]|uniref:ATP-dependent DNA helicase n=1 Tax=Mikania micrantha TaxID=192012 RepID=A0A5N6LY62_9ASTR|nr:hypothetical protein E3N88_34398 [Mikania micrantha]